MNLKQAKSRSLVKWDKLSNQFRSALNSVTSNCGFCELSIIASHKENKPKCFSCRRDYPEIAEVCHEMLDLFSDLGSSIDIMITRISETIHAQEEGDLEQ